MSSITAQQTKLDLELVPKEKRLEIKKCNKRLNPGKKQREPTFLVVLDALALTLCYSAFLTTVDVIKVYMHARKFKKPSSPKLTIVLVSPEEPIRKSKRVKRHAKKSTNAPTAGVVLRDTLVMSLSKKKDNMTVEKHKGIDLLSEVALTKEAYSKHETDENEMGTESDQEVKYHEEEKEDNSVKTPSNYTSTIEKDEDNVESKVKDKAEGDEDKGIDYTANQFDDDVDIRLNEPVNTDEGLFKRMTEVPVTSSSHSSNLASKFLNFLHIPHTDVEIVSPMDVHVHHEEPSNQTPIFLTIPVSVITEPSPIYTTAILQSLPSFIPPPPQSTPTPPLTTEATNPLSTLLNFTFVFQFNNRVSALEKEASELKKDDLQNTQVTALVNEHLELRIGATKDKFMSYLSTSTTVRIIDLTKDSSQPQSTYEATALLTKIELKKILIDKMDENKDEDPSAGSDRGLKKRKTSKDTEPTKEFEVEDSDMPQDQEENLSNDDEEPKRKTKATQYDLPGIEHMVPKIWSVAKVAYDKHTMWGISHWRDQRKTFYGYAQGLASSHDVYYTKCILSVTQVENSHTNLSGNDVSDFAIALRMFTRSMVIQKKVEDLQLGVESYQKKINVTKPETTKLSIRKGTHTLRLQTSLDGITKNIRMEYMAQKRWSSLEKKRAHIEIKAIDKQVKEIRMMRSFEKFSGGRHYKTNLWLLQRTI
nr:hypothetical protein [Tanacetum cinerariifolium]